jgi:hypothetical protein
MLLQTECPDSKVCPVGSNERYVHFKISLFHSFAFVLHRGYGEWYFSSPPSFLPYRSVASIPIIDIVFGVVSVVVVVVVAPSSAIVTTIILISSFLALFFYHDGAIIDNIGPTHRAFVMIFEPLPNTSVMEDMIALIRLGPTKRLSRFKFTQANGTFGFTKLFDGCFGGGSNRTRQGTSRAVAAIIGWINVSRRLGYGSQRSDTFSLFQLSVI